MKLFCSATTCINGTAAIPTAHRLLLHMEGELHIVTYKLQSSLKSQCITGVHTLLQERPGAITVYGVMQIWGYQNPQTPEPTNIKFWRR